MTKSQKIHPGLRGNVVWLGNFHAQCLFNVALLSFWDQYSRFHSRILELADAFLKSLWELNEKLNIPKKLDKFPGDAVD